MALQKCILTIVVVSRIRNILLLPSLLPEVTLLVDFNPGLRLESSFVFEFVLSDHLVVAEQP